MDTQHLKQYWGWFLAAVPVLLSVLGTVKNLLDDGKHPKSSTWLGRLMDLLAWFAAHGEVGFGGTRLSAPLLPSRPAEKKEEEE